MVSHGLVRLELHAVQPQQVVDRLSCEDITPSCPFCQLPPSQFQGVVPERVGVHRVHVEVKYLPDVGSLGRVVHDALQGADAAPVPHVLDVEPLQGAEHVGHRGIPLLIKKKPHCRVELLLNQTLITRCPEVDLGAELDRAEDVGGDDLLGTQKFPFME